MVVEKVLDSTPGHCVFQVSEMNYLGDDRGELSINSQLRENAQGTWAIYRPSVEGDPSSALAVGWSGRAALFSTGVDG